VEAARYDVLIVGGGMVGATLARATAGCGLQTAVVEAIDPGSRDQPSYDDRVIALAWGSRLILEAIGVWSALADKAQPIRSVHISDRGHFGLSRIDHAEAGVEALGYVVSARDLGTSLHQGLAEQADLLCPARLLEFRLGAEGVRADVEVAGETRRLQARLLVAADGGDSEIRRQLGIPVREWTYGQTAVIANLTPGVPHGGVAYERFTDSGPLALLPMREGRCSLVWTLEDERAPEVMSLDDQDFLQRLQARFGRRLGRFRRVGRRAAYPLRQLLVRQTVGRRLALVGNAAHTLHPVAGQGFNLGLRDVATLADVLADVAACSGDPGAPGVLQRYAEWRRRDQRNLALITDGLVRVFSNPLPPLRLLRNLGLVGFDLLPPVKRLVTRHFMGLVPILPRLGRGLPLNRTAAPVSRDD
jgi:2-octaprenyl-6-methoxyphenol hydroxylase